MLLRRPYVEPFLVKYLISAASYKDINGNHPKLDSALPSASVVFGSAKLEENQWKLSIESKTIRRKMKNQIKLYKEPILILREN